MKNKNEVFEEVVFRGKPGDVIWRSEVSVLSLNAKIFSRKDCDIVFLRKGAFMGAFNDREEFYLANDEKQGFLSKLFKGRNVSDDCEIFYINRLAQLENKWGTPKRVAIYDKSYDMHTTVGANGSYRFSISNSMKLHSKIQGVADSLSQDMVREFFRTELNVKLRNAIATVFHKNKYGLKDIATITMFEEKIANGIKEILDPVFDEYGVKLNRFFISSFDFDEDFLSQISEFRKMAVLKKMQFEAERDERKEAKETFKMATEAAVKFQKNEPKKEVHIHNTTAQSDVKFCNQCGDKNPSNSKFCSNCGSRLNS